MRSLLEHPILLSKNAELKQIPHCVFQKCGVCFNCPLCFHKMQSPLGLPTVLSKNAEFIQLPTLFLKNVQSAWTPHCLFKKCRVYTNSSLWFPKMRSSHKLLLCRVCLNSHSVFKKCRVQMNSPLCSPKVRSLFQLPTYFYRMWTLLELPTVLLKMWSPLEHTTVFLKNAEFTWTPPLWSPLELPPCGVCLNSHSVFEKWGVQMNSLCFPSMRSLFQLPTCFYKMWSLLELSTVLLKNGEFISTPHSVFTQCAVCLNPPLSFKKMWSLLEYPLLFFKNVELKQSSHCVFKNAEFISTPHAVFTKCAVCLNPPLSF